MLVEHLFPADGEYTFNLNQSGGFGGGYIAGLDSRHKLVMTIDGQKVFQPQLGGEEDLKALDQKQAPAAKADPRPVREHQVQVKAGPHKVGVTFIARTFAESDDTLEPMGGWAAAHAWRVRRSKSSARTSRPASRETPSRQKIFVCRPANEAEELPCATKILSTLARGRLSPPGDGCGSRLRRCASTKWAGEKEGFDTGIQQAVMAILASPKFLYRAEARAGGCAARQDLSDQRPRARLAPLVLPLEPGAGRGAAERWRAAASCASPAVLETQVQRLLADPRSKSLVTSFAVQWLKVDEIDHIEPDPALFPEFDGALRNAFRREIELFVDSIFSRRPERAEPAHRGLHVRERAAGAALRHPERARRAVPPRARSRTPIAGACSARAAS